MLSRMVRRMTNAHPPIKTLAALIAAMFAASSAPAFDWSAWDLSTQYQDSGGTLPVTAVEQPVGLVLDRSKGGAKRGNDVVLNGGFNDSSAWTSPAPSAVIGNGVLTVTAAAAGTQLIVQAGRVVVGKIYEVTYDVLTSSGGAISVGTTAAAGNAGAGVGRFRDVFVAASTTLAIFARNSATTATVDNVQVREITGPNLWTGTPEVKDANWTDNGDGSFTSNGNTGLLGWPTSRKGIVAGRTYECIVRVTARTAGQLTPPYDGAGSNNTNAVSSTGTFRRIFTAATTALYIYGLNFNGTVDSIYIAEIPGIHRIQPTSTSRPMLTARVNRLSASEALDNTTYWAKSGSGVVTVTPNVFMAPDGTMSGDEVAQDGAGTSQAIYQTFPDAVVATAPLKFRVSFRAGTVTSTSLSIFNITSATHVVDNAVIVSGPGAISGTTFRNLTGLTTGAWTTVELTCNVPTAGNTYRCIIYPNGTGGGTTGASVGIWGAHAEQSPALSRYQRVNTPTDYDTVGFAKGWRYDGTDDGWYSTALIDLTGTDKLTVVTSLLKLSDAATAIVIEFSPNFTTNNGTFFVAAPNGGTSFSFAAKGTAQAVTAPTGYPSPYRAIVTGQVDIGAATSLLRINGSVAASTTTSMGTGNFGSYLAYFGRRNNNALPLTAIEYGMRLIGRRVSPDELGWLEAQAKRDMSNDL